jgi:hypothetical protein
MGGFLKIRAGNKLCFNRTNHIRVSTVATVNNDRENGDVLTTKDKCTAVGHSQEAGREFARVTTSGSESVHRY